MHNQCFLVLDSACGPGSVAVFRSGECLASLVDTRPGNQARALVPMVEQVLQQAQVTYASLDAVVSTVGPGSFTGIRIALSVARAVGLALHKPVIGISTLATISYGHAPCEVRLNAGKGEAYVQAFDAAMQGGDIRFEPLGALDRLPDARQAGLALLAHPHLALPPEPVYIRPPDALLPGQRAPHALQGNA